MKSAEKPISRIAAAIFLPTLCNAVFGGMTGIALPLALIGQGFSKFFIPVFYIANSAVAVALNVWLTPALQRRGYPRAGVLLCAAAVPTGVALVAAGHGHAPIVLLGGFLMMFVSTIVPIYMGVAAATAVGRTRENVVADLRRVLVVGYLAGLGLFALLALVGTPPLLGASVVAAIGAATSLLRWPAVAPDASPAGAAQSRTPVPGRHLLLIALVIVVAMKSADVLRVIYLPLYATVTGIPDALISALFAVTVIVELIVLQPLARCSARHGSPLTLAIIAFAGAVAFTVTVFGGGVPALLVSQAIYAVFAAGFQSIGLVQLGRLLPGGTGAGASAYMAVVQVGTVFGVVAPLAFPGYTVWMFLAATGFCAVAFVLSLVLHRPMLNVPTEPAARAVRQ